MALAPFFDRIYGAVGAHLTVSRESLTQVLGEAVVGIHCGEQASENDRWIAELATNLVARLYPRVAIFGGEHANALRELALKINPKIDFEDKAPAQWTICTGATSGSDVICPNAAGWVVQLNGENLSGPSNPYSSGAAAALACAQLFRRVFLNKGPEKPLRFSLLDFQSDAGLELPLPSVDIGSVIFAGAGAVGNSALWALGFHATLSGKVFIVDAETIELSNLQRYVLAMHKDVGKKKVDVAEKALTRTALSVQKKLTTLERFGSQQGALDIPTIAISTDNVSSRRAAQGFLPRIVVSGWTSEQGLGASWHEFANDAACLACLYHPKRPGLSQTEQAARVLGLAHDTVAELWVTGKPLTESQLDTAAQTLGVQPKVLKRWRGKSLNDFYTDVVCGAVPLDLKGVGLVESVPLAHQSALAGILMAAETVKRADKSLTGLSHPEPLVSWDNVLEPTPAIWRKPRPREAGCICTDSDYQSVYRRKWNLPTMASATHDPHG